MVLGKIVFVISAVVRIFFYMGLLSKKMMQVQLHSDHVDLAAVVEIVSDGL